VQELINDHSYFFPSESFGNPTRIDYGTGHEFKFCVFLCCLMKLGVVPMTDAAALVLKVFEK
jgi:serine/threonine-protein phosphatase 2A activator